MENNWVKIGHVFFDPARKSGFGVEKFSRDFFHLKTKDKGWR